MLFSRPFLLRDDKVRFLLDSTIIGWPVLDLMLLAIRVSRTKALPSRRSPPLTILS
jgi:hypothetical protein